MPEERAPHPIRGGAELKSESVAELILESAAEPFSECPAELLRNPHRIAMSSIMRWRKGLMAVNRRAKGTPRIASRRIVTLGIGIIMR